MRKDKETALCALLTSDTQAEAAKKAGISRRTISTYLSDPEFAAEYRRRKRKLLTDASNQIQRSMKAAITALDRIVKSEDSKNADILTASRLILEFSLRYEAASDMLPRLEEAEELLDKMQKQKQNQ